MKKNNSVESMNAGKFGLQHPYVAYMHTENYRLSYEIQLKAMESDKTCEQIFDILNTDKDRTYKDLSWNSDSSKEQVGQ